MGLSWSNAVRASFKMVLLYVASHHVVSVVALGATDATEELTTAAMWRSQKQTEIAESLGRRV